MPMDNIIALFGWMTVINVIVLTLTMLGLLLMRDRVAQIHARMFGLEKQSLEQAYFHYLANYKLAVLIFNLVPYIAMKVVF